MLVNNAYNAGNFVYCSVYFGPHMISHYYNDNDGHYHQWLYIVEGDPATRAELRDVDDLTVPPLFVGSGRGTGELLDVSDGLGKYVTTYTADKGLAMIMFNPIPTSRNLDVEILKGPIQIDITAENNRKTIVCINGPIQANNSTLSSLQHAKIFPGKTVNLTLSENTICAIVQDK